MLVVAVEVVEALQQMRMTVWFEQQWFLRSDLRIFDVCLQE